VKRRPKDGEGRQIHIRLSDELHRRVRIRVAELDISIQDWVVSLVESALKGTGKGRNRP
jgi:predicted HicB family RNase H-like nuclease